MIKQQDKHIAISCYPFGVGNNTEGVAILLQIADYSILLDCGLKDISLFCQQNTVDFNWVFCSHAHDDHAYGLLSLHQYFSDLPIYASEVTAKLLPLNWLEKKDKHNLSFVQIIPWRSQVAIAVLSREIMNWSLPGCPIKRNRDSKCGPMSGVSSPSF